METGEVKKNTKNQSVTNLIMTVLEVYYEEIRGIKQRGRERETEKEKEIGLIATQVYSSGGLGVSGFPRR